jgi:2-dehydro-3-deoxygluconokinase
VTIEVVTLGEPLVAFVALGRTSLADSVAYRRHVVGAETNVAIGLARLGHSVALVGHVGDDAHGIAIGRRLRAEGVDVAGLTVEPTAPTGILIRDNRLVPAPEVVYVRSGSAGSRLSPDSLTRAGGMRGARWLHLTGITPALSESASSAVESAIDVARASGATVSFDVNMRRRLWRVEDAAPVLARLACRADIVLGDLDELEIAAGGSEPATRLLDAGVSTVVTKAGAKGASSLDANGRMFDVPAIGSPHVIDPIGAGDAFCAGFIAARLEGADDETALRWGAACGAAVVSVHGDVDGLPTRVELERMLEGRWEAIR